MRPYVGRRPTVPHAWLGEMIDPSVSVPSANPTSPAAVEAADPALDPLDVCSVFHGVLRGFHRKRETLRALKRIIP